MYVFRIFSISLTNQKILKQAARIADYNFVQHYHKEIRQNKQFFHICYTAFLHGLYHKKATLHSLSTQGRYIL